jgi:Sec7-like guanine-nucleotide exchange factor
MEMFDFRKLRLDIAMRRLCSHLFLIGEAQVIDRVIHAFSKRYWTCNPHSILGNEGTFS